MFIKFDPTFCFLELALNLTPENINIWGFSDIAFIYYSFTIRY